jgi:lipopolysaccharide transport system ATP-binding protein
VRFLQKLLGQNNGQLTYLGNRSSDAIGRSKQLTVGIVGTFDVENYGDLLFPLMAETAFARRGRSVRVMAFSPNRRSKRSWPFRVYSTEDMPELLPTLSAVLIGGGQIFRFDKGYPIPTDPAVPLPIAYWLIPAVLGALIGKPVVWNAIGAWTASPPAAWYDDVVSRVLSASHFIGVRDVASQQHLAKAAPTVDIQLVPDTAFSLSRFWPLEGESNEYVGWRESLGVGSRYVVIQADHVVGNYRAAIKSVMEMMGDSAAVILPICRYHGDRAERFPELGFKAIGSPAWLSPRLISEIIGRSEIVIASSLHACISALSYGVPAARVPSFNSADRKFELLNEFEGVASIDNREALTALVHRGRKIEPRVLECIDRLDCYWDKVQDVVLNPHTHDQGRSMALMLGWVSKALGDIEALSTSSKSVSSAAGAGVR